MNGSYYQGRHHGAPRESYRPQILVGLLTVLLLSWLGWLWPIAVLVSTSITLAAVMGLLLLKARQEADKLLKARQEADKP